MESDYVHFAAHFCEDSLVSRVFESVATNWEDLKTVTVRRSIQMLYSKSCKCRSHLAQNQSVEVYIRGISRTEFLDFFQTREGKGYLLLTSLSKDVNAAQMRVMTDVIL